LNRIVTEVLDFAKPITFEFAESSINDICLASAAAAWAGEFDGQVALELDSSLPRITTDPERLARRSSTSSPTHDTRCTAAHLEESPGSVVVRTRGNGNGHVVISIRDRGIGIAAEDMPHIFDPYFTTRRAGTGLGLPISKKHHRRPRRNACRRQRARRRHRDPDRSSDHASRGTPVTSIRGSILLADDEEKILKRLGRALRDEGHEVVETTSAKGAQRQLVEKSFDLLVVDNVMPG
jgi:hypothetical protein